MSQDPGGPKIPDANAEGPPSVSLSKSKSQSESKSLSKSKSQSQSESQSQSKSLAKAKAMSQSRSTSPLPTVSIISLVSAAVVTVVALFTIPDLRSASSAAIPGVALGVFSFVLGLGALIVRRKTPRKLGLSAAALLIAALACAATGALAWLARSPTATPNEIADPNLRAWTVGQAEARARSAAMFGLVGVSGVALGALGMWLGVRARKNARASAPPLNVGVESVPRAWVALAGASVVAIAGVGVDVAALTLPIVTVEHPEAARARAVAQAVQRSDLTTACGELERLLDPAALPSNVLEHELPTYREIADRCVSVRIQALPTGLACVPEAGKLLATRISRAAGAEDRIKHACGI